MTIYIRGLIVEGKHGWHEHEKTTPQKFSVSVELELETQAGQTDKLEDTVNWSETRAKIIDIVENSSFNLIEKLAQTIAQEMVKNSLVKKSTVEVDKLEAFESGIPGARAVAS
jgi:dihydroneopterin aldolase